MADESPVVAQSGIPTHMIDAIKDGDMEQAQKILYPLIRTIDSYGGPVEGEPDKYYRIAGGHKFVIDTRESELAMLEINNDLIIRQEYEPETGRIVKEIVKEGDVVVDVGASIGHFSLLLASLVKKTGKVLSFEPTKNQFVYLKANIKANGYEDIVTPFNLAALDKTEKNLVRRDDVNSSESARVQVNDGLDKSMEGVALDDVLPEKVDFIKIDVDGSEPKVLKGLIKTFERNPNLKMVIEYYPKYIEKLGNNPQDMMDILDKYFTYEKIKGDYNDKYWNYICTRK